MRVSHRNKSAIQTASQPDRHAEIKLVADWECVLTVYTASINAHKSTDKIKSYILFLLDDVIQVCAK